MNNKKTSIFASVLSAITVAATAAAEEPAKQMSFLVGDGIAAFVPENFDAAYSPSLILNNELDKTGELPTNWTLKPVFSEEGGKKVASFDIGEDVSLYGGGEVTGPLLRNGQSVKFWNTDTPGYSRDEGKRLYQTHPWAMGVRPDGTSFGIIFDCFAKSEMSSDGDKLTFGSYGEPFKVYVFERENPKEVLKTLAELTGTISMPPLWSLGYHQCRFSYFPDSKIKEIADTFRKKQISCDVIWFDIDYMDGYRIFTIDKEKFPDPKALNDYLHSNGFKSVFMIDPGVKVDSNYHVYKSGVENDVFVRDAYRNEYHGSVWPGECAFPDFTRPEVREWWAKLYEPFLACGIDGIWNDMNEPSVFDGPDGTMPESNIHLGGGKLPTSNHKHYHNAYGRLMVEASHKGIMEANPDKRPFILSRANLLGGQRFAAMWTGDNRATEEQMRMSIPMSLTMGLSGQPFNGPDIGGFLENTDGDLFGKWIGFGAFFPFSRGHACDNTNQKEPWVFGPLVEKESRMALQRRYRLIPYYYTLFRRAHTEGLPVMAPVFFADVSDASLRDEDNVFLIGDDLLVIPSIAENPTLPKGIWEPLSLVKGDNKGVYQAALKVRGGSIIPIGQMAESLDGYVPDPLTLIVCLDEEGKASGQLYWDAGDGWDFENGEYALISFKAHSNGGKVIVEVSDKEGKYPLDLANVKVELLKDGKVRKGSGNIETGISLKMP